MEIEDLLELIELILTQKDEVSAFSEAILKRKFCLPYFNYLVKEGFLPDKEVLLSATQMRQFEFVRFILEHGVKPTLEAFQYAAVHEFFELCRLFVEFGSREILTTPELEREFKNELLCHRLEEVKRLINQGVYTINNIHFPIRWASQWGDIEIVRLILQHGVDREIINKARDIAISYGHFDVIHLLSQYRLDT